MTFNTAAPSDTPRTFTSTLILSTNITVQWKRVRCRERNSEISHYILHYFLADGSEGRQREVNVLGVGDSDRMYTVTRLHPASSYTLTIAAVNTNDQRGPNISINASTAPPESKKSYHHQNTFRVLLYNIQVLLYSYN